MKVKLWKTIFVLSWFFALGAVLSSGCSPQKADKPQFPIGRFESVTDKYKVYIFSEGNQWKYEYYGEIGAEGKYKIKDNLWIEQGTSGECPFPGTYEWVYKDDKLTFKLVGMDQCDPRREATDGQTFVLVR
ncbi:MAG: hypothetical protein ACOY16_13795 [Chloroflexota bacterium]